jgi:GNAT superfamily N-acetyltransferase
VANGGGELPPLEFGHVHRTTNCGGFRCISRDINMWFQRRALKEHSEGLVTVTCAFEAGRLKRPLGFYALATVAEEVRSLPGRYFPYRGGDHFSALQLAWLATDNGFTRRGLGELMVGKVIRTFASVGPQIGLPHLIVIPDRDDHERLSRFYSRLGFAPYRGGESMFLPLQSAVEAVGAEEQALAAASVPLPEPRRRG